MNEIERQERNGNFVAREVYCCQSMLVEGMLEQGVFNYEDIENFYQKLCPECGELIEGECSLTQELVCGCGASFDPDEIEDTPQEIYEWWVCSDWMIEKLRSLGEPILTNDYGDWWGRCCTGQAIKLDNIIDRIIERN